MEQLFREAANEKILLNPGDMYDFAPNHALRLSYAYEDCQTWETAAVKLAQIIRKLAE